jgi:hypothetical protein
MAARRIGTKLVVASGLVLITVGLGLLSRTTVSSSYRDCIGPFALLGIGVALALAPCTESIMGSLPRAEAGVGSATNDAAMQVGGALGVGVLGTALTLRYQNLVAPAVVHANVPPTIQKLIESSLGGALAVAQRAPGTLGDTLVVVARHAFISGMDLALMIAAVVVAVATVLVLLLLPSQGTGPPDTELPETAVGSDELRTASSHTT